MNLQTSIFDFGGLQVKLDFCIIKKYLTGNALRAGRRNNQFH